jgi:hypothetical protein
MSHQFKPGDLAILLTNVETVTAGSIVTLNKFVPYGAFEEGVLFGADVWTFDHPIIPDDEEGFCEQKYLMPLRGDFTPQQQKSREVPA